MVVHSCENFVGITFIAMPGTGRNYSQQKRINLDQRQRGWQQNKT